ncbi:MULTISPECIES: profilin [Pseudomonas]|uniref:profilin n=1 Tax=Pseudomonas TaxID=286 RepID=UPI002271E8BF|nr:profilin [Pseudomonas putida]WAC00215.1 profilin [Pseudomonas putida]
MSWQAYVDNNLVGTGFVSQGAILGLDGSTWASSPGLCIAPDQIKPVADGLAGILDLGELLKKGLTVNFKKYLVVSPPDSKIITGRGYGDGIVITKTKHSIIVGFHYDSMAPGKCASAVEKLADELIELGY